jgi:RNA polymerase sigma-70 factor (ECF subfamily)
MSEVTSFQDLIQRVRGGEVAAAAEVVRRYEPALRRAVRVRLRRHPRLRRLFDSADVCQSVLASFFVRAALGQYDLSSPEHLLKLLATIARNKVLNQAKKQQAQCRDQRRVADSVDAGNMVAPGPGPSQQVEAQELLQEALRRLAPRERAVLELRGQGLEWGAIAAALGDTPDALRMQLTRAAARITRELGLNEEAP